VEPSCVAAVFQKQPELYPHFMIGHQQVEGDGRFSFILNLAMDNEPSFLEMSDFG